MSHSLNNPIWNALISGNSQFATGTESIKYFPENVAPFVGLQHLNVQSTDLLYDIFSAERVAVIITAEEVETSEKWEVIHEDMLFQMTGEKLNFRNTELEISTLDTSNVPDMLALTKLTNPGPFSERTIEFGHYKGIMADGKLVAMAGRRTHVNEYIEISAVCTHPSHLGKGYAGTLLLDVAQQIIADGCIPYLHVRQNNESAVKLYEKLGFKVRADMRVKVIKKRV